MTKKLEIVLALIFVGASLAFGGVQPLGYSLVEILVFVAVILFLGGQKRRGRIDLSLPVWPFIFVLWIGLQLLPLPRSLVAGVSPAHRLTSAWLETVNHAGTWTTLSIYPDATLLALFKVLAYLGAFVLAAHMFDSGRRKSYLITALILLGCFQAGYGIVQHLLNWNKIFWVTNPYDFWVATGTYFNRNHFAGLVELAYPFTFALAFYCYELQSDPRGNGSVEGHGRGSESSWGARVVFYLFLAVIMIVSVVFSYSRGGILAVSFTLMAMAVLTFLKVRRKSWGLIIAGLVTLALGFSLWIGIGGVLHRFVNVSAAEYAGTLNRAMIWEDTLHLLRENLILGTGLGTYGVALRPFQTHLVNLFIDHAHNDYLEFACETGLIGFALLSLPVFYLLMRMVISFLRDRRRYRSAILLGCIGSTLGLLIHSITDFNLQVPANALIFAIILGIGYKAACVEPRREARERNRAAN